MFYRISKCFVIILLFCSSFATIAETAKEEQGRSYTMNNDQLDVIIRRLDDKVEGQNGYWQFKIGSLTVTVITDKKADRMRIMIPVIETEKLEHEYLYRIMQANFDSTLDARYAIAKQILWSVYLHPLSSLNDDVFITAIGQTVNLVSTFGTSYSSGLLNFGGGDSKAIQEKELIQKLLDKGRAI
jgi:hypothetical protein